jgi:hypothetical protein
VRLWASIRQRTVRKPQRHLKRGPQSGGLAREIQFYREPTGPPDQRPARVAPPFAPGVGVGICAPRGLHQFRNTVRGIPSGRSSFGSFDAGRRNYLRYFPGERFRRRTPGPPPFSSMNSTPAASKARRTAKSLAAVIEVSPFASSARRIVLIPRADFRARSSALHLKSARPALIWALVRGLVFILT